MRTNIEIDDDLMQEAMDVTGLKTKKETVDEALRALVGWRKAQRDMLALGGKIEWEGDLDQMRRNRFPDREW